MANNNWANRTKSALSSTPTTNLIPVGAGNREPINVFYQYSEPKGKSDKARRLAPGSEILGTYDGSFVNKTYGTRYFKVRTEAGLVAIPATGQLNSLMARVPEGAEVKIVYNGKERAKTGKLAGKELHSFAVAASQVLSA